jgi:hypothetical protein
MSRVTRIGSSVVLAAVLLAGCAGTGEDRLGRSLVAPGGYDFYDCAQLTAQEKALLMRDKDLARLIAKAKQGPAGGFVSAVTYEPDYAANKASLREVRRAQLEKKCPPSNIAPAPARRSDSVVH